MKLLIAFGLIAAAAAVPAHADTLFDNGAAVEVTLPGSPGRSVVREGGLLFGQDATSNPGMVNWSVADNFTVGGAGWIVQDLSFFAYADGSAKNFLFTDVVWNVISGDVNTGTLVASGTTMATNGGLVGYRVGPNDLNNTDRAIFQINANVPDFNLAAGSYWLTWSFTGLRSSDPKDYRYQPPVASGAAGNAQVSIQFGLPYVWSMDPGDELGMEFPFVINGTVVPVPEPSTYALMLAGGLAVVGLGRCRRREQPDDKRAPRV